MELLDLANEIGLNVRKTSNFRGGEYHSNCPGCGEGVDRFVIWPYLNRYWCRRCDIKGDAIQFCRDFLKMSFRDARQKLKDFSSFCDMHIEAKNSKYDRLGSVEPSELWMQKAMSFVNWSHTELLKATQVIKELQKRGFKNETIIKYKLGFSKNVYSNTNDFFCERTDWGLPNETKDDGKVKKLWLPFGLVIPTISNEGMIQKLKVRRAKWHVKDVLPKYVEIVGSMHCLSIYGDRLKKIALIVESELDAMLIQQEVHENM